MENGKRSISFLSFAIEMHFRNMDDRKKNLLRKRWIKIK